ncbi:YbaB/EbfC DNA-binding family protein [Micromonospora sediminicola]|uniref:YbaB/EbfC DNA-binding family protein n=1 Tax=Micromonospora sediminicola TaxID=946078 RepID=A0A1A9BIJ5_9ACTN|nr:YbaB/EbfC family nucleoid-associated protein [Micromonospora sediminicola]SBT69008.1 YbaB/EbfC DNA-binding family protein [Micromonospora sediminicola]
MAQFPMGDFAASTDRFVASWVAGISERAARAQALSDEVAAMSATAEGAQGAVRVTVAASGAMTDLRLDDRVLRWRPDEIAATVLAVMRRAQGRLAAQVAEAAAGTVGADSETARAVVGSYAARFPEVPEEDDPGYAGWSGNGR